MSNILAPISIATLFLLHGCSSTNLASTAAPATITEQRIIVNSTAMVWGVNKIFQIGDKHIGFYGPRSARLRDSATGATYTVDSGPIEIMAWYYDNMTGNHLVNQTSVTKVFATLKPAGRYELRSKQTDGKLKFVLYDVDLGSSTAESDWVAISRKTLPEPRGGRTRLALPEFFHIWK